MYKSAILFPLLVVLLFSCKSSTEPAEKIYPAPIRKEPKSIAYQFVQAKSWLLANKTESHAQRIAFAVNRTDSSNFAKMDSVIMPVDLTGDIEFYLPFPLAVPYLENIPKIIYFSYPTQSFATYEHGNLIYAGPTNMGREKDRSFNL